ncbi:hypothetical protein NO559_06600 [Dasania sp. GY-MA-18]|uniref:Uncharacterized protein n=1 Tax=Dasania phycosphaerae TaxID=2950436 RepID=A0A9J6RL04_9GAMM|nr:MULTISPECIES: hypothetical protein [Dasania]MCR8922435.1 hypothetical protein [Dasania sp. GY-MA-18]MCZ0864863.1 hypothetical protein [Dasania phycosphaerae]MCZ0868591.1 hypothetical protein [Dasania phycosphaerae]
MSETYSVVLTGKLLNSESLDEVKANVGAAFKLSAPQVDKLFGGKPVALKRGLDKKQAVRLSTRLQQLGAHAVIKATAAKAEPAAEPAPAKPQPVFTDIVASMDEPAEPTATPAAAEPQAAAAETAAAEPELSPAPSPEPVAAAPADTPAAAPAGDRISCPRCGHEQAFATACGRCKMDLSLHIKRMERRAKVLANRR